MQIQIKPTKYLLMTALPLQRDAQEDYEAISEVFHHALSQSLVHLALNRSRTNNNTLTNTAPLKGSDWPFDMNLITFGQS